MICGKASWKAFWRISLKILECKICAGVAMPRGQRPKLLVFVSLAKVCTKKTHSLCLQGKVGGPSSPRTAYRKRVTETDHLQKFREGLTERQKEFKRILINNLPRWLFQSLYERNDVCIEWPNLELSKKHDCKINSTNVLFLRLLNIS